ncbi:acyltransferase family protein [Leucobacter sp. HY1910]
MTTPTSTGTATAPKPGAGKAPATFFPQVHALRAIAVLMVLVYHLWPARYTGGFIGVDVFLVISGFLITGHIWRQREQSWRLLPKFWLRRVLRLGPAALTVVTVTGLLTFAFVPQSFWERYAREAIASVLISVNFVLFGDSVDYLAADNAPTPFQHYWSLSVEEQFYLVWPLLIIAASLLAARIARRGARRLPQPGNPQPGNPQAGAPFTAETVAVLVIAAASVASFAVSLAVLPVSPSAAYFMMPLRIWEFGAGALLALLLPRLLRHARGGVLRTLARIALPAAYAALVLNGYLLSGAAPFPGWNALLPVALTALVILSHPFAEMPRAGAWAAVEQGRVTTFLGDVSYSAYLWHWPLIIIAPFMLGHDLTLVTELGILAVTLLLAWVTTRWIETPLRSLKGWDPVVVRRRITGITSWALVAVLAWTAAMWLGGRVEAQAQFSQAQTADVCFGAQMALSPKECGALPGEPGTDAALMAAATDKPAPWPQECVAKHTGAAAPVCEYLADDPNAPAIVLWGDSHAGAWSPAFEEAAKRLGLSLYTFTRDGCPPAAVSPIATIMNRDIDATEQGNCADRNAQVQQFIDTHPGIVGVFAANLSTNYIFPEGAEFGRIDELLAGVADRGYPVVLMGDVPLTGDAYGNRVNIAECLATNTSDPSRCDNERTRALDSQGQRDFVRAQLGDTVTVLDSQDNFCDSDTCYAAIGGVPVFFDQTHLTDTFSRSLGPWLSEAIAPLIEKQ